MKTILDGILGELREKRDEKDTVGDLYDSGRVSGLCDAMVIVTKHLNSLTVEQIADIVQGCVPNLLNPEFCEKVAQAVLNLIRGEQSNGQ